MDTSPSTIINNIKNNWISLWVYGFVFIKPIIFFWQLYYDCSLSTKLLNGTRFCFIATASCISQNETIIVLESFSSMNKL